MQLQQTCYNSTCHSVLSVVKLLMINFPINIHAIPFLFTRFSEPCDIHKVNKENRFLTLTQFYGIRVLKFHAINPIESLVSHHWRFSD